MLTRIPTTKSYAILNVSRSVATLKFSLEVFRCCGRVYIRQMMGKLWVMTVAWRGVA